MAYQHELFDHQSCDYDPCEWHIFNANNKRVAPAQ